MNFLFDFCLVRFSILRDFYLQFGRNLIEFARASTPRLQRRVQSTKTTTVAAPNAATTPTDVGDAAPHLHPHYNYAAAAAAVAGGSNNAHNAAIAAAAAATAARVGAATAAANNSSGSGDSDQQQQQQQATPPPPPIDAVRISLAHPDYHIGAFLDENARPVKLDLILDAPPPTIAEQEKHAWNPDDRSLNIYVKDEDRLTLHRHPVAQSTDCIRG